MARNRPIRTLADMHDGQAADCFLLLAAKDLLNTREGKPYHRVTFRDATREVGFPIWGDAVWAVACRDEWQPGQFYKLRAALRETTFGPQLDILKIRPVTEEDRADGFDPLMCRPQSRFDREAMFRDLRLLAETKIDDRPLSRLTLKLLDEHRAALLTLPAASRHHHTYVGGWLEHVLSVTRTCVYLADKYADYYPDLQPPLSRALVVAGGILHDIGKLLELREEVSGAEYTPAGRLVGHILQGRDLVRDAAVGLDVDPELLLRLEHIIVSHQRLPEWGSPKPPMTPEALLVHYADDCDAKFHMYFVILRDDAGRDPFTSSKNVLNQRLFRGGETPPGGSPPAAAE